MRDGGGAARIPRLSIVVMVSLSLLAGCGLLPRKAGSADGTPHTWVGGDAGTAVMVQLTRQGSSLTGTVDQSTFEDESTVKPAHVQFTGTLSGTALTLTFTGPLGSQTSLSGTLTKDDLSLSVPRSDGSVGQVVLRPSTVDHYNDLVAGLRTAAETAAGVQASTEAVQAAAAAAEEASSKIAGDMDALQTAVSQPPGLEALGTALADARAALGRARAQAAAAGSEKDVIAACDKVTAAADQSTAVHDADSALQATVAEVDAAATKVNELISTLDDDLVAYRGALAQAPDDTAIAELRTRAQKTATSWTSKSESARKKMAALIADAEAVVVAADKKYCK
ncbi:hypothetical protein [Actinoplanes sp. NPDC048796]|uniref:hypothetical protein n=1 Tax=Actinoplanes sp. NPDC048796 TaxID=3155640 RepID=UPI0033CEAC2B